MKRKLMVAVMAMKRKPMLAVVALIALIVVFFGVSKLGRKTSSGVTAATPQPSIQPKLRTRKRHSEVRTAARSRNAVPRNAAPPCSVSPVTGRVQPNAEPVAPGSTHDQLSHPSGSGADQAQQYQNRRQTTSPIAPETGDSRRPAVVWISANNSLFNSSVQARVVPVQRTGSPSSVSEQRKTETGFRPFLKTEESGKDPERGFKPFRR
jgi:hypothetical protein